MDFATISSEQAKSRTAGEAGWHVSRYNVHAPLPGSNNVAIAILFKGNCAEYTAIELYLLSVLEELDENHPIIERFFKRGIIANFDERAMLETMGRASCAFPKGIALTICPTMGCNFNCPYCFEDHFAGKMSPEVQDDVVGLAQRMAKASGAQSMSVTWFGGEPLLAPNIIDALSQRLMTVAKEYGMEYSASIITTGFLLDQDIVDMLERCKVSNAQITIDGLGPTHDITRKLANGDPTFERITTNLRELHIPFRVNVRHNVNEANKSEMDELRAFIEGLAEESGNRLRYYPAPVLGSRVADERGEQVDLLCGTAESEVGVIQEANRFYAGRGNYCGAHSIWSVGIDEKGNLQKCWEAVDKPDISFGTAAAWDPTDALFSATKPDNLSMYLNTAVPVPDEECRQCVWLPHCVGGCPHKRIFEECKCVPYKDDPASYVLALHARIGEDKKDTDQNKNHTKG